MTSLPTADCTSSESIIPSCGVVGCTHDFCSAGALTPIGSLGFSIWSNDELDFPITFGLTDGIYPKEWKLPTFVDGDTLLANLLASLHILKNDSEIVPFNFQLGDDNRFAWESRGSANISTIGSRRSSNIPVIVKTLASYKHQSKESTGGVSYRNLILVSPPPSCSKNRAIRTWWKRLGGRFAPDCTHHMPVSSKASSPLPPTPSEIESRSPAPETELTYCQALTSTCSSPKTSSTSPPGSCWDNSRLAKEG